MKKYIVVINGTGGCGKDTFVEMVSKYNKVYNVSSVDKVKEVARVIGWDGGKTDKDRKFLFDLKTLTTEYNNMAFNDIKSKAKLFETTEDEIMFIHIREPENIKIACEELNAFALLIERTGQAIIETNYADASVKNYNYDIKINNDTLEGLDKDAKKFYNRLQELDTNGEKNIAR